MFVVQGPVDPRDGLFVGREAELALMEEWLRMSRCVGAVLGARQTGKTSLLLRSKERLSAAYRLAFVNLEAIEGGTPEACFAFIAQEIADQVAPPSTESTTKWPSDGPTFLRFLRTLSERIEGPRVGVLIDEVGALPVETCVRLAHTLRATFTNRHVRRELGRYQFVIAGSADLMELTTGRNSPLRNVTEMIHLTNLAVPESRRLLQDGFAKAGVPLPVAVEEAILGWTSGHPYWTQLLASRAAATGAAGADAVDQLAHELIATEDRNLPHVRRCLADLAESTMTALDTILGGGSVPFTRTDSRVAQLELLGLISDNGGRSVVRNRFYRETLNAWRPRAQAEPAAGLAAVPAAVGVFVSYAHADESFRVELGKHLSVLERQGLVASWHDRLITPGSDWASAIDEELEHSQVILLLVSADFIHSRYCYEVEMRRALERHTSGQAIVIPVVIRPVAVGGVPFAHIQCLPRDMKAVTDWPNRDSAYVNIVEGIRSAIAEFLAHRQPSA